MKPGTRVEITTGVIKGERATIEVNLEYGSHIQKGFVWLRFDKDGQTVQRAILTPQWTEIKHLRIIK